MATIDVTSNQIRSASSSAAWPDSFVQVYGSYLEFIKVLPHIDALAVQYAPASGWTDISATEHSLRVLGKSDRVIQLVRQLPRTGHTPIAGNSTRSLGWHDNDRRLKGFNEVVAGTSNYPGTPEEYLSDKTMHNAIGCKLGADEITITNGGREESNVIVNCATGQVHDHIMFDFRERPDGAEGVDAKDPEAWRTLAPAQSATELFTAWRQKWLDLVWVSHPAGSDGSMVDEVDDQDEVDAVKQVYIECGWPNDWRREECIEKLEELAEQDDDDDE